MTRSVARVVNCGGSNAGAASGVAFGCLLGMFPLLFFDAEDHVQKSAGKGKAMDE